MEHIIPNVIVPQNNVSSTKNEPVYSNIPPHNVGVNQCSLLYCNTMQFPESFKLLTLVNKILY